MMVGSASSSSSALPPAKKYDVFISFRGEDTRSNFTSHLHGALSYKKIETYIDDRLHKGDKITPALIKAIEDSYVSIVIISKNYACSSWCLDELTKILECKEKGQIVLPVFYNIDPSHVRKQTGNYKKAFAKHEQDFQNNKEKVQKWKTALTEVANLTGWHSQNYRTEYEFIEKIVKNAMQKLNHIHRNDLRKLVGIDQNYACIKSLLRIGSGDVQIIGIWGMGGIGKTTLAAVAFARFSCHFEGSCFLANVREESEKHGLHYLRNELLSQLLEEDDLHVGTPFVPSFVMSRLNHKEVFIVLDDVNASEQVEYLVGEAGCLGVGSRVIITTRDKHVLSGRGVYETYEVKKLNFEESLQLFSMYAFKANNPVVGYEELSERVIDYAQGNPLALKTLGAFFCSRNKEIWKSALQKLKKHPYEQIQKVLRLSFDGLDVVEKKIFLDIACFFRGVDKEEVIRLLDACNFYAAVGLERLLDMALISVSTQNTIEMHDLIQEMGRGIVREESLENLGGCSRLWDAEEICDVLENNMGTDGVEVIKLDMSQMRSDVHLSPNTFTKMSKLRLLIFYSSKWGDRSNNLYLPSTGLCSLPKNLRYLRWDQYPLKSLPTFYLTKLVKISMKRSNLKKLWDGVQDLVNLKKVDFSWSIHLIELPDFSKALNLEDINLAFCTNLCEVHPSIFSLPNLVKMSLWYCKGLMSPENAIRLGSFQRVLSPESATRLGSLNDLGPDGYSSLKEFSRTPKEVENWSLDGTAIVQLPSSIECLIKLRQRENDCESLKNFRTELFGLTSLSIVDLSNCGQVDTSSLTNLVDGLCSVWRLVLRNCSKLYRVPDNISLLSQLRYLDLSGTNIETLPTTIFHLSKLQILLLSNCMKLRFVPELPPSVSVVDAPNCTSLETFNINSLAGTYNSIRLESCVKLDPISVNTMLNRMKEGAIRRIVYPRSKVPNWITYQTTQSEAAITIEPPPSDCNLLGVFFCVVLSQFSSNEDNRLYSIECSCNQEEGSSCFGLEIDELTSDNVYVWYDDDVRLRKDDIAKLSFEFQVENFEHGKIMDVIKGCGVQPIYDTDFTNHNKRKRKINDGTGFE